MRPHILTSQQIEEFRELYPVVRDAVLGARFGMHPTSANKIAKRLGLKKSYPTFKHGNNRKKVMQLSDVGEPIMVYDSVKEASRALGYSKHGHVYISAACRGIYSRAYGFKWKYIDEL